MKYFKIYTSLIVLLIFPILIGNSFGQITSGGFDDSPFERKFGDVKFLDGYFGTIDKKIEVSPGDQNVPFTVVLANVGSQDITGIRGQLSLPYGFSAADGPGSTIYADSDSNSITGENFHLTFFVNIDSNTKIQQYPGTVKVDYSRLRESGVRNAFFEFDFKVTGKSVINVRPVEQFLTSLKENSVLIEISNDGKAPISSVDVTLVNTQSERASTTQSITNIENVVISNTNWEVGQIKPGEKKYVKFKVYVPESLKGATLRTPIEISYFNTQGDQNTISRIADFYVKGFIDVSIYNIDVIELSDTQMIIGEIINEGNEDALFGFVTLETLGTSNIKTQTQFIDEIETDSPVPFNIPVEFDGQPKYGEHEIKITVRYKDDIREEIFVTHESSINVPKLQEQQQDNTLFLIIPVIITIGVIVYFMKRRKKQTDPK